MCKTKSNFSKHKNSHNFKAIGSSDLKLSQKLLTTGVHHPAKFQPPTPSGSKVTAKKAHFHSFQDHYIKLYSILHNGFFQDHYIKIHSSIGSFQDHYIRLYSNTPQISLSIPQSVPLLSSFLFKMQNLDHFKTLVLVYFQSHGRWTAHFPAPKFNWHAED